MGGMTSTKQSAEGAAVRKQTLRDPCFDASMGIEVLGHNDARAFADWVVDLIIKTLRPQPHMPRLPYDQWVLQLADLQREIAAELTSLIENKADLDEAVEAIADELATEIRGRAR